MIQLLQDNRQKFYWLAQLGGWGAYALLNQLIMLSVRGEKVPEGISDSMFYIVSPTLLVTGILLTHLYRGVIKRYHWQNLDLKGVTPRILLASATVGILIYLVISTFFLVMGIPGEILFTTPQILINWINLTIIVSSWSIIYFALHYFENYQKVEIERFVWEAAVKDFELKTLKSQLNPHFMFNAMNGIRSLIEEDPEKAKSSITRLSNIFRYSLNIERSETVPLEDEIKTVNDYLALEQIRYEERLNYKVEVESSLNFIEIPPMMIQTLVENGIKHGVSKLPKGGVVELKAYRENDNLFIIITNSGVLDDKLMHDSKGYGLANTRQRLLILYGGKASFDIMNSDGMVKAVIKIPTGGIENESYYR